MSVGFKGCIREFESENEDLRERPLDLTISEKNDPTRKFYRVKKCGCKDVECQNGGSCEERPEDFRCECKIGYTGPQCQIASKCIFFTWYLKSACLCKSPNADFVACVASGLGWGVFRR